MTEALLRVVLDINVLVSAYFFSGADAPPRRVFVAALDKRYQLLHSTDYQRDLQQALSKTKFEARLARIGSTVDDLVGNVVTLGEGVQPIPIPEDVVRDKDDITILACAVGGKADYVVTGDNDLLTVVEYRGIRIVTPAQFLEILKPPDQSPTTE